jgi:uncharacterized repeat protein (TIGR01451 family)
MKNSGADGSDVYAQYWATQAKQAGTTVYVVGYDGVKPDGRHVASRYGFARGLLPRQSGGHLRRTISEQRMSASTVMPGGSVTYSITVTNAGNVSLDNVDASDTYDPADLSFVSASPAATTSGGGSITWNNLTHSRSDGLPTVWESGKARTITVTFTALGRSKIRRTAPAWSQTK